MSRTTCRNVSLPLIYASSIRTLIDLFPQGEMDEVDVALKLKRIIDFKGAFQRFGILILIRLGQKGAKAITTIKDTAQTMEVNINLIKDFLDNHTSGTCSNKECSDSLNRAFSEIEVLADIAATELVEALHEAT